MASRPLPSLPLAAAQAPERADAARNREKILAAAQRLVAKRGIENVSMDMLAAEACVGKGTIFRRFGDRQGLALQLLDEQERAFQDGFVRGEPPLGPGAPPVERLRAFGHGWIDLLEANGDIIRAAESGSPGARFRGPYSVHRMHVASLIRELDPRLDAEYHADSLLSVLSGDQYLYMRRAREMPIERIRDGWDSVVAAVEALATR